MNEQLQDMTTPEARAAHYEQCWTNAAEAGNRARAELEVQKNRADELSQECGALLRECGALADQLGRCQREIEEIQGVIGCNHLDGLAIYVRDLTNAQPCVIMSNMKRFDFSILRFRKYPGGFSVSICSWIINGRIGNLIHFGVGSPSPTFTDSDGK